MTAQIAIMNKNAVAIATDSAVTTSNPRGIKVHNSANKLFTLSKYRPVGIMVYANAEFMGFPWETLIKVYRQWLGTRSFPKLTEYAKSFFDFLLAQEALFTLDKQSDWLKGQALQMLGLLNEAFNNAVRAHLDQVGNIDEATVSLLLEKLVEDNEPTILSASLLTIYTDDEVRRRFQNISDSLIDSAIQETFQAVPIDPLRARIKALLIHRLMSDSGLGHSGLVFAGFGDDEMLPVVESHWTDAIFAGVIRHALFDGLSQDLNESSGAWIIPFAQSDTVYRFLNGIDPKYKQESLEHVDALLAGVTKHAVEATADLYTSGDDRTKAAAAFNEVVMGEREAYRKRLQSIEQERFLSPVIDVIDSLPKDDLAAIAESFVNLTSFQRKILREVESVGGPIDVAVISKGDGFIWIKRKHYFQRELNPGFFANYFSEEDNEN